MVVLRGGGHDNRRDHFGQTTSAEHLLRKKKKQPPVSLSVSTLLPLLIVANKGVVGNTEGARLPLEASIWNLAELICPSAREPKIK